MNESFNASLPACIAEIREKLPLLKGDQFDPEGLKKAAVLVPLFVDKKNELCTLFIKRPETMPTHKGEFAFPGGSLEEGESFAETALRETEEELGISPAIVEIIGTMPLFRTYSGFCITPVLGWLDAPPELKPNPAEVDEVITVSWKALADPKRIEARPIGILPERKNIYFIHLEGGKTIWGATAFVVLTLVEAFYKKV